MRKFAVSINTFRFPATGILVANSPKFIFRDLNHGFGLSITTVPTAVTRKGVTRHSSMRRRTEALLTISEIMVKTLAMATLIGFYPINEVIQVFAGNRKPR